MTSYMNIMKEIEESEQAGKEAYSGYDMVDNPFHYTQGDIECIDAIRAALGAEGFMAFCRGNSIKYLWRYNHKGGKQDLKKAQWYLEKLIEEKTE